MYAAILPSLKQNIFSVKWVNESMTLHVQAQTPQKKKRRR